MELCYPQLAVRSDCGSDRKPYTQHRDGEANNLSVCEDAVLAAVTVVKTIVQASCPEKPIMRCLPSVLHDYDGYVGLHTQANRLIMS